MRTLSLLIFFEHLVYVLFRRGDAYPLNRAKSCYMKWEQQKWEK